jgi:hypothetical protein
MRLGEPLGRAPVVPQVRLDRVKADIGGSDLGDVLSAARMPALRAVIRTIAPSDVASLPSLRPISR